MKIKEFLLCETPPQWISAAAGSLPVLLIDHANCEKKAAGAAMNLMYRYIDKPAMMMQLSRLAREELRHFEQVLGILQARDIEYVYVSPARYAGELRKAVRTFEPGRLIDMLIVGALVEARNCERFEKLVDVVDAELSAFYASLLKSEARHFETYLEMARQFAGEEDLEARISHFLQLERRLIESPDSAFRFHSGVPA